MLLLWFVMFDKLLVCRMSNLPPPLGEGWGGACTRQSLSPNPSPNRERRKETCYQLLFAEACARTRSSCSLSSGVNSAPKSSASNTWRISTSVSSKGARLSHSIASSRDSHFHSQKPATSSFVSANGPSITDLWPFENFTRVPFELGCSPSPA